MPDDPNKITRLVDMLVEEVSLVDRAANRRKFLVVKRSDVMPAEVVQMSDGTFTAAQPASVQAAAPEATPKAAIALTKDAQSALEGVIENALKMVEDAQVMVKKAKIVETPAEHDVQALVEVLLAVAEGFEDSAEALGGQAAEAAEAEEPKEAPETGGVAPEAAPSVDVPANPQPAPTSMGMGKRLELLRAERVLRKAKVEKSVGVAIQKLGARMAKERLARFKSALDILGSLMDELGAAALAASAEKALAPAAPAPVASAAPAAQAPVVSQAEVAKLFKQVEELQVQLKKREENDASLRASRARSNGIPVEKAAAATSAEVSWPLDMNRPIRRDTTEKDSFFESGRSARK